MLLQCLVPCHYLWQGLGDELQNQSYRGSQTVTFKQACVHTLWSISCHITDARVQVAKSFVFVWTPPPPRGAALLGRSASVALPPSFQMP